jgi:4-amino-4-deoxy-L-arabinose transferase-like glycosyltransferase
MTITNRRSWWIVAIAVITILPFIGLTEFNTKGEPREAVVALSMINEGNWILPINNGGDIPYKPPFFHWLIALFSLLPGYVSEFTARLPSALALIIMVVAGYRFFGRRGDEKTAFVASLLTLTAFEVHRAGMNCRVDMVLTACIVGALYLFYRWYEKGMKGVPWLAILCMSLGTLTKGPVGIILPCFVMGVFLLLQRENFWLTCGRFLLYALLACILPVLWYVAAWQQGGDAFLDLVKEENLGRFMGKMTYESHENPFYYNFITLIAGWIPWTLLLVLSLPKLFAKRSSLRRFSWRKIPPLELFTWLSFLLILFFYCIPKSKRSVYLLPVYPFMGYLLAKYFLWLVRNHAKSIKVFTVILGAIALLLTVAFMAVKAGWVPETIFQGKHAEENLRMLTALENKQGIWMLLVLLGLVMAGFFAIRRRTLAAAFVVLFMIFISLDGLFQPTALNTRSDRSLAYRVKHDFIDKGEPVYMYTSIDMLHFFGTNFYLGDKMGQFLKTQPDKGVLMIVGKDRTDFMNNHSDYSFVLIERTQRRMTEMKDTVYFYRFSRSSMK